MRASTEPGKAPTPEPQNRLREQLRGNRNVVDDIVRAEAAKNRNN